MGETARNRLDLAVLLALIAISVIQAVHYYPLLPDNMASHFDLTGRAAEE